METSTAPTSKPAVKILVVDDHPNTATMLARALAQLGPNVQVVSATSGREALKCVNEGPADILITDMIMPEMTGLELIEELHKHPAGRPAASFLITAYDVPGLTVTARRLKVKEVIVKPVHPERVCKIITQAMEEMEQVTRPIVREAPQHQKAATILVADDQPDNVTLLTRYLNSEGFNYITAVDGIDTLKKVRTEMPDLVLLDVNMPYMDGFAVLEEIRKDEATKHIPVIILTAARLDPTEIQSGLNMGADDYVTKPFDRRELLARIRTKLRVKQAEDEIRRHNRELNLLPQIGQELSARLSIEELATILLKRTVETLGAMLGHLVILSPAGMYQQAYHIGSFPSASKFVVPLKLLDTLKQTREGFIVENTKNDLRWQALADDYNRSAVVVPMFGRYDLLGALVLTNEKTGYFTESHMRLLQAITSQASIAVENAQLYDRMAQEQGRLAAVLQHAADAILMFDREGRLSMVNPAGQKLFTDYPARLGRPLPASAGYDAFLQFMDQARLFNATSSGDIQWPDKRVFSASITPVQEGGCVAVLHDVTRFKELERVKDEFIANASHDLRNPISTIKGFSQLLKRAGPLNEQQEEFAGRILHASENMSELVENMLNLAKMDLGAEQKREIVDIAALLADLVREYQPQAEAKEQTLTLDEVTSGIELRGDGLQLRQALGNLLSNAIKYTPQGGKVSISTSSQDDRLNIHVVDTGCGISANDLPYIFDRFYRVQDEAHEGIEGNGLGLAIVKTVAEAHQGSVSASSEPAKGTRFTFSIPFLVSKSSTPARKGQGA